MAFNYNVCYADDSVVNLFGAMAPAWKTPAASVAGLDVAKLYGALVKICDEWREKGDEKAVDKDLQALLAVAVATPWFSKEQTTKLDELLEEVASAVEEDWIQAFEEKGLTEVINKTFSPKQISEVTIDKDGKSINVEYKGGNFGTGKHDGRVHISDDGLCLYDHREVGKYKMSQDDLPGNLKDLDWCLQSENWKTYWDEDTEEGGQGAANAATSGGGGWSGGWDEGGW